MTTSCIFSQRKFVGRRSSVIPPLLSWGALFVFVGHVRTSNAELIYETEELEQTEADFVQETEGTMSRMKSSSASTCKNMEKELDQFEGEMEQKSAEIRGETDAQAIQMTAEAYGQSPEFYEFLRGLDVLNDDAQPGRSTDSFDRKRSDSDAQATE